MYKGQSILNNHQVMFVINIYLKFMPKLIREKAFKEMIKENILVQVNTQKVRIKNINQSLKIDKMFSERMNLLLEEEKKKHFWYNHEIINDNAN